MYVVYKKKCCGSEKINYDILTDFKELSNLEHEKGGLGIAVCLQV
jgi:hypothetical protein